MAKDAGAKRLFFTHHEPLRTDDDLDAIQSRIIEQHGEGDTLFTIAFEGLEVLL
jgi:phosphoribosyl 1,2-cyclic phosphodiesterase